MGPPCPPPPKPTTITIISIIVIIVIIVIVIVIVIGFVIITIIIIIVIIVIIGIRFDPPLAVYQDMEGLVLEIICYVYAAVFRTLWALLLKHGQLCFGKCVYILAFLSLADVSTFSFSVAASQKFPGKPGNYFWLLSWSSSSAECSIWLDFFFLLWPCLAMENAQREISPWHQRVWRGNATDISLLTLKIRLPFLLSPTPLAFVIHPRPQVCWSCKVNTIIYNRYIKSWNYTYKMSLVFVILVLCMYPSNEGNPLLFDGLLWRCCDRVVATLPQAIDPHSRNLLWHHPSTVYAYFMLACIIPHGFSLFLVLFNNVNR